MVVNTATLASGTQSGISGTATVTGVGSNLIATNATVGEFGAGSISVEDGGSLTTSSMTLGLENGSSGNLVVNGAGSVANTGLGIGKRGIGIVQVESGGRLETGGSILRLPMLRR
jgi:autotransporter family porin